MLAIIKHFRRNEGAATMIEYGLIAAMITVAAITIMGMVGVI